MNHRIPTSILVPMLMAASVVLLACDLSAITGARPTVVIASPPSGAQFHAGETVAIQSTATDSVGIARVELSVDGNVVHSDPAPGAQISFTIIQTWTATAGSHTLGVRAYNTSNNASDPASVTISVLAAPTATLVPTEPSPGATATRPGCTYNSIFVADVTIPDNTLLAAGQAFDKTWRIRNTGNCAWGTGFQFAFVNGTAMTTATAIPVPATAPGATTDLRVPMVAPDAPGTYNGVWRLKNASGAFFGTTVTVVIRVGTPLPPTPAFTVTPPPRPAGCNGTPVIPSFVASPASILSGGTSTLSWGAVANADSAEIDQGIGGVATPGNIVVTPSTTTTYTLTARCGNAFATSQVTVFVNNPNFGVTGVTVNVNPGSANTCPAAFVFSASITANGPGVVVYRWERSDGSVTPVLSLSFAGFGSQTVTTQWNLGSPVSGWARLHILSPNEVTSNQAPITLTCPSSFQVTRVLASVSPVNYIGPCSTGFVMFKFIGEITASGAGTATYRWERSDGAVSATQALNFTGLGSESVINDWSTPAGAAGWAKLHVLTPNDLLSGPAEYTIQCR